MLDTSIENTLFQAEFNTPLQLSEVLDFMQHRLSLGDYAEGLPPGVVESDLEDLVSAYDIKPGDLFDAQTLLDAVLGAQNPKEVVKEIIANKDFGPSDLFNLTEIADELTDEFILEQYEARGLSTDYIPVQGVQAAPHTLDLLC